MRFNLLVFMITLTAFLFLIRPLFGDDVAGTVYSRPNVSGGYDFYDSAGDKTGYSTKRPDGGYDYYDRYGNKTGYLVPTVKTDKSKNTKTPKFGITKGVGYSYYDADNMVRGKIVTDPYGGYRYYEQKEGQKTASQMDIRRNYEYANTYGKGIGTLPPKTLQGQTSETSTETSTEKATGLETSPAQKSAGLNTKVPTTKNNALSTSSLK